MELPQFTPGLDFQRFRAKARQFLRKHDDIPAVRKLRTLVPLTREDLGEIEALLLANKIGTERDLQHARATNENIGLFLRGLSGLQRAAAKDAFNHFLNGRKLTATQIEFLNLVIDHIADQGFLEPELLYESPFIDLSAKGVDGIFPADQASALFSVLQTVKTSAVSPSP